MKNIFNKHRPLSWSAISSFEYDKEKFYQKYVLGVKEKSTPAMDFGRAVGEKIASDPTYLPQVPRLAVFEHKFSASFSDIPLIGYADTFCPKENKLGEFKTGVKPWTKTRVSRHGQIDMYLLMHYLITKTKPEDVKCQLIWLPTQANGDFSVSLIEPCIPQVFETKRTMSDIIKFGKKIKDIYKEMLAFCEEKSKKLSPVSPVCPLANNSPQG